MLKTKRVYEPPDAADGIRILVMRHWPRGVRKDAIHERCLELAPSAALLRGYRDGSVPWNAFMRSYLREIGTDAGQNAMSSIRERSKSSNVTLLCHEPDGEPCHRHILYRVISDPRLLHEPFSPEFSDRRER